jgi:ribosomal protein S18 acetylase RimI-like enzyme
MARAEDLARVRSVLETDREWAAYALADLAPEYRGHSEWHLAAATAVVLVYRGFRPPVLFALGSPSNVIPLLAEIPAERELYAAVPTEVFHAMQKAGWQMHDVKIMSRMVLNHGRFDLQTLNPAERLGSGDYEPLLRLYKDGERSGEAPDFFNQSMLRNGSYFGIRDGGVLVAAAGTHVFAPDESVAGIGNVYTRRDRRRRGFARLTTAAVIRDLLDRGVRTIALNVSAANQAAIRVYERLGFAHHCEFREARAIAPAS